jgi:hypothetical protein
LFVASLLGAAAVTDALVQSLGAADIGSGIYYFGGRISDTLLNLFATKMAGVFMFSTCTNGLRTQILARWLAFTGYACALLLLLVIAANAASRTASRHSNRTGFGAHAERLQVFSAGEPEPSAESFDRAAPGSHFCW